VSYQTNPRVTETNIYDSSDNRRRTTIDYDHLNYAQYGLPYLVKEYAADGLTEIRHTFTDYNLAQAYLDPRIIGLVSSSRVYDPVAAQWQTKVTYGYDDQTKIQSQATTATQHDQSFGASFLVRGNVTSISRWDVTDIDNATKALTTQASYNAAGSVLSTTDPLGHTSSIDYTDAFAANGIDLDPARSFSTFAYPTTLTDADGFSSFVRYYYEFGGKTRVQGPPPAGQSQGAIQIFAYDGVTRLERVTTTNNGAYTHYIYGPNYVQSYSTVNNVTDEAYSVQMFDGAGRVIRAARNHPGSIGGYSAVSTQYDAMGRVMKQSNPTEVNSSWTPTGDDAAGWVYTQQTYDWKSRPLETTHLADGTVKYASYGGCGCAGGEVATLTDEVGRQQKVYSDVLGRTAKAEILQTVNNITSVYSTTANTYNARDQVTLVRQFQGADTSGVYQDTTMSYDGYGRLLTKHVPEQNAGTATAYTYNTDDSVQSVTDARGASATYAYNGRHLVTGINYSAPAGITPTSNVSFGYDADGNRTSMTDGFGSKSYAYNQLSQLMSETRTFNGVGTFTLSYDYNLAGELKKITDATNMTVNYGYDAAGRVTSVTGSDSLYAGISNYASNIQYRSWGGLKAMTDGTNHVSSLIYNSKLQPSQFDISGNLVHQNYDYYNDGQISFVHNTTDANFDRSYFYDHVSRLTEAKSGGQARAGRVGIYCRTSEEYC
jgi:YD repeat-containing protein